MDSASTENYDGIVFDIPDRADIVRSPADILNLVLALLVVAASVVIVVLFSQTVPDPSADLGATGDAIPGIIDDILLLLVAGIALGLPLAVFGWYVVRQPLIRAAMLLVAFIVAVVSTTLVFGWLPREIADASLGKIVTPFYAYVSGVVAGLTVANSVLSHRQRKIAWTALWIGILIRVAIVSGLPVDLAIALGIGWACGSLVRFTFGTPNHSPTGRQIVDSLRGVGLEPVRVKAAGVDARGSKPYFVDLADGDRLFVKTLSKDERSADILFRMYRTLFLKNIGDEPAFSSLRRAVEHEALAAMVAASIGVRTPAIRAGRKIGDEDYSMLLAQDAITGESLDRVSDERMTNDVLRAVWQEVRRMHAQHLAHRDLRLANIFLDESGDVWMIDFGFSEVSADQVLLDTDVAELVMSTALKVGSDRAVATAVDVMGTDAVRRSARRMQPLALSGATRNALKESGELHDEVLETVRGVCGMEEIHFDKISRLSLSLPRRRA
ncbi:MAG: hypothetical protein M3094_04170 [Actinomycetia bacterium]|nr:hypothetical protein [Actinomycetes bacterium]